MLGLICVITCNFNNSNCLLTLYKFIICFKLEYCSCVWNFLTCRDFHIIESLQNSIKVFCNYSMF
ncbi:hypothetical protein C0J52_06221 [Blattella germanica]|nr:hypothetical protein C0J52_06221 [Blattella germanica]